MMPPPSFALLVSLLALPSVPPTAEAAATAPTPLDQYQQSLALWNSLGPPADYDYSFRQFGELTSEMARPKLVRVRNGEVESASFDDGDGEEIVLTNFWLGQIRTIEGLFGEIGGAIDGLGTGSVAEVDVTYDPNRGNPADVRIDYDAEMEDDELLIAVSNVVILGGDGPLGPEPEPETEPSDPEGPSENPENAEGGGTTADSPDYEALRSELGTNRDKWESFAPDDYAYFFRSDCFCMPEYRQTMDVTVRNGAVESVSYVDFDGDIPEELNIWTVSGAFDKIQSAIDGEADEIRVTYDESLGYPSDLYINEDARIADLETRVYITDVVPAEDSAASLLSALSDRGRRQAVLWGTAAAALVAAM